MLYIGGLRGDPQEKDLEELIRRVSGVENVALIKIKYGGNPHYQDAFAFIKVEPESALTDCVKAYHRCRWKNSTLRVEKVVKPEFSLDQLSFPKGGFNQKNTETVQNEPIADFDDSKPLHIRRKRGRRGTMAVLIKPSKVTFDELVDNTKCSSSLETYLTSDHANHTVDDKPTRASSKQPVDIYDISESDTSVDGESSDSDEEMTESARNGPGVPMSSLRPASRVVQMREESDDIYMPTEVEFQEEKSRSLDILSQLLGKSIAKEESDNSPAQPLPGMLMPPSDSEEENEEEENENENVEKVMNGLSEIGTTETNPDKTSLRLIFEGVHADKANASFRFFEAPAEDVSDHRDHEMAMGIDQHATDDLQCTYQTLLVSDVLKQAEKRFAQLFSEESFTFRRNDVVDDKWIEQHKVYVQDYKRKKRFSQKLGLGKH